MYPQMPIKHSLKQMTFFFFQNECDILVMFTLFNKYNKINQASLTMISGSHWISKVQALKSSLTKK